MSCLGLTTDHMWKAEQQFLIQPLNSTYYMHFHFLWCRLNYNFIDLIFINNFCMDANNPESLRNTFRNHEEVTSVKRYMDSQYVK